jgi:hypothetical protein
LSCDHYDTKFTWLQLLFGCPALLRSLSLAMMMQSTSSFASYSKEPDNSTCPEWLFMQACRLEAVRATPSFHVPADCLNLAKLDLEHGPRIITEGASDRQIDEILRIRENLKAANANPQQMVAYVHGRPVVGLVITHERSRVKNIDSHLTDAWHPYPLHYVYGRCASLPPVIKSTQALWYTWTDIRVQGFHITVYASCNLQNQPWSGIGSAVQSPFQRQVSEFSTLACRFDLSLTLLVLTHLANIPMYSILDVLFLPCGPV